MRAGFFLGIGTSSLTIFSWLLGNDHPLMQTFISLILIFFTFHCIIRYTKQYDEVVLNGGICYLKALSYGIHLFFFATMILSACTFTAIYLRPSLLTEMTQSTIELLGTTDINAQDAQDLINQIKSYTAKDMALSVFWGYMFMGFFACAISSIYFRKRKGLVSHQ